MEPYECFLEDASRIGGYALDGCEFLLARIEGVVEFLKCGTCKLSQNFHHKVEATTIFFCLLHVSLLRIKNNNFFVIEISVTITSNAIKKPLSYFSSYE
jgi:hypothetical protein